MNLSSTRLVALCLMQGIGLMSGAGSATAQPAEARAAWTAAQAAWDKATLTAVSETCKTFLDAASKTSMFEEKSLCHNRQAFLMKRSGDEAGAKKQVEESRKFVSDNTIIDYLNGWTQFRTAKAPEEKRAGAVAIATRPANAALLSPLETRLLDQAFDQALVNANFDLAAPLIVTNNAYNNRAVARGKVLLAGAWDKGRGDPEHKAFRTMLAGFVSKAKALAPANSKAVCTWISDSIYAINVERVVDPSAQVPAPNLADLKACAKG